MIIFPLVYLSAFLFALKGILTGRREEVLLFVLIGLPLYITSLCIAFDNGFSNLIGLFQSFKEVLILVLLGVQLYTLKTRIRFHLVDYAVTFYFCYLLLYALTPLGDQSFLVRLLAFKSLSFFPFVYFCGRLFDPRGIYINKYFHYIVYFTIAATGVVLLEFAISTHFQSFTGYADFYYYIYNFEPTGEAGLSWTFETETGLKRFASFFANPLEFASSSILALSVIAALYTTDLNKFKNGHLGIFAFGATLICIILALSRAAFINYFFVIYIYAILTNKRYILNFVHFAGVCLIVYITYLLNDEDVRDFVISTLNFTNSSSVGHVLEWVEGINAIAENPLGLGLGTSGRVGASFNGNTGGENQLIIIGVQAGVVAMLTYIAIYIGIIAMCWKWFPRLKGRERQVCLALLLMKIGLIIPMMTSELESSAYISYTTWFFTGFFICLLQAGGKIPTKVHGH